MAPLCPSAAPAVGLQRRRRPAGNAVLSAAQTNRGLHRTHRTGKRAARIRRSRGADSPRHPQLPLRRLSVLRSSPKPGAKAITIPEIRTAGSREGVVFPGWVTDIHSALAATDLLLVPSAGHEATTRVILEAHSAGVPVVAFRSGGIPEVVDEGRDGWLADSTARNGPAVYPNS